MNVFKKLVKSCVEGGFHHDWQVVEAKSRDDIYESVGGHIAFDITDIFVEKPKCYVRKVCLRCGKICDTIEPQAEQLREIVLRQKKEVTDNLSRLRKAKEILKQQEVVEIIDVCIKRKNS